MPIARSSIPLYALMAIAALACAGGPRGASPDRFFELTKEQRYEFFDGLNIEDKYETYIRAMTARHPPDLELAWRMADSGDESVTFLIDQLKDESSESNRYFIVLVFEYMARRHTYDFRANQTTVGLLQRTVADMRYPLYKEAGEESLKVIMAASGLVPQ